MPKSKARYRKLIVTKMVFKKKEEADGTIRCKFRCVAKSHVQIPGVDFAERSIPVATNDSIFLVVALTLFC